MRRSVRYRLLGLTLGDYPLWQIAKGHTMSNDRTMLRKEMKDKMQELKSSAIADLERRGYEIRGKTTTQIRQILKRRPTKAPSIL